MTPMSITRLLVWAACAIPVTGARGQDAAIGAAEAPPLDEIVVVAHKAERRLREVAANVTVLTRQELAGDLVLGLGESFRYTPGVDEELAGTRFGSEGISIRGIGGNRVALVVDGVRLGDQFDIGNFSNATRDFIDAGFIQRIEVLHGPASALYGSDAIGGVVAVRTLAPADVGGSRGRGGILTTTWRGADASRHGTALAGFGDDARGLLIGASLRDGGSMNSAALANPVDSRDFLRRSALLKFTAGDSRAGHFNTGVLYQDSAVKSDLHSMLGTGRFASTTALTGDDESRLAVLHAELRLGDAVEFVDAGVLRVYGGKSNIAQATLDVRAQAARPVVIDRRFEYEQAFHGFEANLQRDFGAGAMTHRLGAGVEYRRTRTEELRDGTETGIEDGVSETSILGEAFPLRDFPVTDTDEWGVYLEDTIMLHGIMLIAALRSDHYELSPREDEIYSQDNRVVEPVALGESDLSPKLGLVWQPMDSLDLYLQYAHGFRAPPFEDANIGLDIPLFNIRAIPNPDLHSERSDGWDAGLRIRGDLGHLHLGVFHTRYRDFIESKARIGIDPASGTLLFQSRNVDEARIEGIEGSFSFEPPGLPGPLGIDGAFYAARGENRDSGEPLNSVGPAQAVLGVNWRSPDGRRQLRLVATLTAAWTERDETAGALFQPAGSAVVDLLCSQAIGERAVLRAGVMNLTDRTWWQWSAVRGLSPDDPLLPTLAQPGRNLSVGLEWNWY